jgi:integration host factor subunit beta
LAACDERGRSGDAMMNNTVTKKDLVDRIADKTASKRVLVKKVVQCFLDEIVSELGEGNRLEFRDFGVFEIRSRAARVAQNPKTMEKVFVPSKRTVKFKIGRLMKQRLFADDEEETRRPRLADTEAQAAADGM